MKKYLIIIALISTFLSSVNVVLYADYIFDEAKILTDNEKKNLNDIVCGIDRDTSVQIGIIIITSLEGKDIFDFSIEKANELKFGQKYINNGCLITISINDRKMRMELGYGLEWVISDINAAEINEEMMPFFKTGSFYKGLEVGISEIYGMVKNYSWKIEYNNIKLIYGNKQSFKKIIQVKARYYGFIKNHINLITDKNDIVEINYTDTMTEWINQVKKSETGYFLITGRISNYNPVVIDLIGLN
jgi:hypothetical protein